MTRRIIAFLDTPSVDGRVLVSPLEVREGRLPVSRIVEGDPEVTGHFQSRLWGYMEDVQVFGNVVTAEFPADLPDNEVPEIDCDNAETVAGPDPLVMRARLCAATLGRRPVWPRVGDEWTGLELGDVVRVGGSKKEWVISEFWDGPPGDGTPTSERLARLEPVEGYSGTSLAVSRLTLVRRPVNG